MHRASLQLHAEAFNSVRLRVGLHLASPACTGIADVAMCVVTLRFCVRHGVVHKLMTKVFQSVPGETVSHFPSKEKTGVRLPGYAQVFVLAYLLF